jgi:hypothetical protein
VAYENAPGLKPCVFGLLSQAEALRSLPKSERVGFLGSLEMRTSAAEAALQRKAHGTRERVALSKTVICNLLSRALKQSLFFRNALQAGRGFVVELFEPEGEV